MRSRVTRAGISALAAGVAIFIATASGKTASSVEYGVHADLTYDGDPADRATAFQSMAAIHATVSRASFLWHKIEPTQGTYDWSLTDDIVNHSVANRIDPLMVVYGSPAWANGTSTSTRSYYLIVPQDPAAFATWVSQYAAFMSTAAKRYKGKVKKWELWNEENQHFTWQPVPNPAKYVAWYTAVHAAIRTADPTCTVSVGGLAGLNAGPTTDYTGAAFLRELYAAGVTPEAVAIHPYSHYGPTVTQKYQNSFSDIAAIHQIMTAHGQGATPLWVTEWGWDAAENGADDVAQYITQSLGAIATQYPYVTVATYFNLKDVGSYAFGLYDRSWTIRPGGTAFAAFTTAHGQ